MRTGWWIFAAVLSFWVLLQILPFEPLARALGPYPEPLWRGESQPGDLGGWHDYAHNDLLQWLFEMGVVRAGLLAASAVAVWRDP